MYCVSIYLTCESLHERGVISFILCTSLSSTQNYCVVNKNHNSSMLLSFISSQGVVHERIGAFLESQNGLEETLKTRYV